MSQSLSDPDIALAVECHVCGGPIGDDGTCEICRAPAVPERDHHVERPSMWVAAVCDRGIRHERNEDAAAVWSLPEPDSHAVLVICDGVSSSTDADSASRAAASSARGTLTSFPRTEGPLELRVETWTERLVAAAAAANDAVVGVARGSTRFDWRHTGPGYPSPPACTFVAAVVDGPLLVAGWVGDSRAYWLPDTGRAEQLSIDDSWATEQIAAGKSREEAEAGPQAHTITRWLGLDSAGSRPQVATALAREAGWLVICSDGLWNYCSAAADLGHLVRKTAAGLGQDPRRTAAELVAWANAQGGQDNVSVGLARLIGEPGEVTGEATVAPVPLTDES